jgi:hypothetical protein
MSPTRVCIGGIDLDNRTSVRLLDANGYYEHASTCLFNIRDIWELEYVQCNQRYLPHSEDVCVVKKRIGGTLKKEISMLYILKKLNFMIYEGDIFNTFEGKLKCTANGSLYISKDSVPENSTCFWLCDKAIRQNNYCGKVRYNYIGGTRQMGHNITYIGVEKKTALVIPEGTLVRLSLAYWWSPENPGAEKRCYLQLSGWY